MPPRKRAGECVNCKFSEAAPSERAAKSASCKMYKVADKLDVVSPAIIESILEHACDLGRFTAYIERTYATETFSQCKRAG